MLVFLMEKKHRLLRDVFGDVPRHTVWPVGDKPFAQAGEIGSEELTRAHLARIEAVDPKVRAFTTVLRAEAIATARRADAERKKTLEQLKKPS